MSTIAAVLQTLCFTVLGVVTIILVGRTYDLNKRVRKQERHYHYGHSSQCDGPTGGPVIPDE